MLARTANSATNKSAKSLPAVPTSKISLFPQSPNADEAVLIAHFNFFGPSHSTLNPSFDKIRPLMLAKFVHDVENGLTENDALKTLSGFCKNEDKGRLH